MKITNWISITKIFPLITGLLLVSFAACSNLVLKPTDYAWPIESVLKVNDKGFVNEERNSLSFNVKDLFLAETGNPTSYMDKEIRLIRDMNGYYYITSDNFKNVYVFKTEEGKLALEDKIPIAKTGLENPAFNQRQPYIELVSGNQKYYLTNEGITNNKTASDNMSMKEGEK
jgi:hypothetical protein